MCIFLPRPFGANVTVHRSTKSGMWVPGMSVSGCHMQLQGSHSACPEIVIYSACANSGTLESRRRIATCMVLQSRISHAQLTAAANSTPSSPVPILLSCAKLELSLLRQIQLRPCSVLSHRPACSTCKERRALLCTHSLFSRSASS